MRKKLLRLLRLAPIALLLVAGIASAQTTGTIVGTVTDASTGKPVAGALVIATSPGLQGEQTAVTDGNGNYQLIVLPPGRYKVAVQIAGYKPAERADIVLRVDYTLRVPIAVIPDSVMMEEQVVKSGMAPVINVGTAEAGQVISREFLATVPTTRTYEGTAIVAPTAQRDFLGISFAGATSNENNYILDGLRVTDPQFGTMGTNLLNNFVEQLDVKVGSFMPEYGYSSAGVINTVTKSGSNEFHGSIWGNLTPGALTPASKATWTNGEAIASYSSPYKGSYNADFGVELGGPIAKDKLWFYVGFAPQLVYNARTSYYQRRYDSVNNSTGAATPDGLADRNRETNQYLMQPIAGTEKVYGAGYNRYFGIGKLTWLINENNNLSVSFNTQPTTNYGQLGSVGALSALVGDSNDNSSNANLSYKGKFFDKHLLIEATAGWYGQTSQAQPKTINGVNQANTPYISWQTRQALENFVPGAAAGCANNANAAGANSLGCYIAGYQTGGYGLVNDDNISALQGNVAATVLFNFLGQQQLKLGAQLYYADFDASSYYSSGMYWLSYGRWPSTGPVGSSLNEFVMYRGYGRGDPASVAYNPNGSAYYTQYCASIDANGNCVSPNGSDPNKPGYSSAQTKNAANAFYIQDSWTIANVLTLNFGVRFDMQKLTNQDPTITDTSEISINDMIAPRVQAIWDFTGSGRGKIQGNWGRYYESVPMRIAERAFGSEISIVGGRQLSTCNSSLSPATVNGVNPSGNPNLGCPNVYGGALGSDPFYGVNYFQQQAAVSPVAPDLKGQYTDQFGGGIQYEVLQDLSLGVEYLGRRIGTIIEDMSSNDGTSYFVANPGASSPWTETSGPYAGVTFNPKTVTATDGTFGTIYSANVPKPERSYDAVTFTINKAFSKKWLAQASYTWSSLRGNYAGLYRAENAQTDPNLTSEYDLVSLLGNKYGPLNGNRENQIKVAGSYTQDLSAKTFLIGGVNFSALSGQPVSVIGGHPLYGGTEGFILPRGVAGDLPWTFNLDLSAKFRWDISGPYSLQLSVDVFNFLNGDTVQWVENRYTLTADLGYVSPMQSSTCSSHDAATAKNHVAAIQAACPDLPYARTVFGSPVPVNANYGQPVTGPAGYVPAYQSPINVRFGVQLSF